jgi:phospholipid/cholesterol/gamma-HCH transport system substrate-binding protein
MAIKISKELRIGTLGLICIVIFILGFNYLKGNDMFRKEHEVYAVYNNVEGLMPANAVQLNGLSVGKVQSIKVMDQSGSRILVTLILDKSLMVPTDSRAIISSNGLLGDKVVKLVYGQSNAFVKDGDTLNTSIMKDLMGSIQDSLMPLVPGVKSTLASLDTTVRGLSNMVDAEAQQNLKETLRNLNETIKSLNTLSAALAKQSTAVAGIVQNVNGFTTNLNKNNQNITGILNNTNQLTEQLAAAKIDETMQSLQSSVNELHGIMGKINNSEGSLGLMVNDKQLYNNLQSSLSSLDVLMGDIKAHPSRYINVTIFGRKPKPEPAAQQ